MSDESKHVFGTKTPIGAGIDAEHKLVADYAAAFSKWRELTARPAKTAEGGRIGGVNVDELLENIRNSLKIGAKNE